MTFELISKMYFLCSNQFHFILESNTHKCQDSNTRSRLEIPPKNKKEKKLLFFFYFLGVYMRTMSHFAFSATLSYNIFISSKSTIRHVKSNYTESIQRKRDTIFNQTWGNARIFGNGRKFFSLQRTCGLCMVFIDRTFWFGLWVDWWLRVNKAWNDVITRASIFRNVNGERGKKAGMH